MAHTRRSPPCRMRRANGPYVNDGLIRDVSHPCSVRFGLSILERILRYRLGQGTVGSTVTVSPLRNVISTLPVNPPLGQVFGTVP